MKEAHIVKIYEYSIETMQIPTKTLKQTLSDKELDGLLALINKKADGGWELVTNTFMGANEISLSQTFVCTFKREKENQ